MTENMHELAPHHLPFFIPMADGSDQLMTTVLIALIVIVLLLGTFYLYLHSLPERLAHKHGRIQFELVAVLGLLALFTHNQIFWVAALVLAFVQLPDFMTPLETIASSSKRIATKYGSKAGVPTAAELDETGPPTEPELLAQIEAPGAADAPEAEGAPVDAGLSPQPAAREKV